MSLKGSIKDFQLEEILRFIDAGKKTGALEIQNGRESVVFYFKNGGLYYIHRSSKPLSLTEKILSSGLLDEETVKNVKTGKVFPPASLNFSEEIKAKISQLMFQELVEQAADVFTWQDGSFIFKNNEKRTGEDWGIYVSTEKFIDKARKHSEVIKKFAEHAKTLKTKLDFNREISPDEDIIISGKEWRFLSNLKPGMTIEEIASASGLSLLNAITVATSLMEKGLLVSAMESETTPAEKPEKPRVEDDKSEEIEDRIKEEVKKEKEKVIEPETQIEEAFDEDNLIDELAAITGNVETNLTASDDTRKELENILKALKEL